MPGVKETNLIPAKYTNSPPSELDHLTSQPIDFGGSSGEKDVKNKVTNTFRIIRATCEMKKLITYKEKVSKIVGKIS